METWSLQACAEALFGPDELTRVLLVKAFRTGEPLVLSESAAAGGPVAPDDLYLVKLVVGPGNPGPTPACRRST